MKFFTLIIYPLSVSLKIKQPINFNKKEKSWNEESF